MPELLIATTKDWKQRKMLREKGCPRGRIPKGLSPRDGMERKLLTKRGRALYKKEVYWWSRCSDRSRKDRGSDGLCDGGWALHRVSGRWQGLPITCSSYGTVAKRLGAGPRHHGTKRGRRPFWGPTSGRWNWSGRPPLRPIAPTPVLVSSPTGL